jgi:hypothetical protein
VTDFTMLKPIFVTLTHSSKAKTDLWLRLILAMLKLTILTMTHFNHAETDVFDYIPFQQFWNRQFGPWHIPVMLKLAFLTAKHSSHTDWNWRFWPWQIPAMLKLTILNMTHFSHAESDIWTTRANIYQFLELSGKAVPTSLLCAPGLRTI